MPAYPFERANAMEEGESLYDTLEGKKRLWISAQSLAEADTRHLEFLSEHPEQVEFLERLVELDEVGRAMENPIAVLPPSRSLMERIKEELAKRNQGRRDIS